jgi:hypothetical protein
LDATEPRPRLSGLGGAAEAPSTGDKRRASLNHNDPYEPPDAPEVVVGAGESAADAVATVLAALPR